MIFSREVGAACLLVSITSFNDLAKHFIIWGYWHIAVVVVRADSCVLESPVENVS